MDTSDVLYRVSGGMTLLSGLFNGLLSAIWFLSMIWVCVGVFWLIPMAIALAQVLLGGLMLATGKQFKLTAFVPMLGIVASMCNFNFFGSVLDIVAICLGIGGFATYNQNQIEGR